MMNWGVNHGRDRAREEGKREIIVMTVTICVFMTPKIHLLEENIKQLIVY